jgi:cell wall-associated NlpC family hydrolase
MHWSDKYIGKPYSLGDADCAALVCEVREKEFSGNVPDVVSEARENTRLKRIEQLQSIAREVVTETQEPTEGDVVLMTCRGRPSHVGIYCVVDNDPSVLHAMENAKMVVRHRLRDLDKFWLTVEGFYKWI